MNTSDLIQAIDLALGGKWDASHTLVQQYEDEYACWIHAVLHKIEGDKWNSEYWYRRAGKAWSDTLTPHDELRAIREELVGSGKS